ncbi:glycoside hydrolase family 25 protein [Lewinella sp. JB7]|uniref:glycoside hydrolase family 25 protein n=1 Tax=Lewinella sp. JB7 TaxID=2962887 RepID=UPI0020C96651|nr:GH25 family lysozyme [Lewinella sp. JB7]MCP9237360.1 glycoside hydrolase family 25 protein [Lewinella sp. JB7]
MRRPITILCILVTALVVSCQREEIGERYPIQGIDVSRYQGVIDWDSVAGAGHHFAFIKASEGWSHRDLAFRANWMEAGRVGLRRGAYHFFLPHTSIERQLSNYIDLVKLQAGDLPPVLDVESRGNLTGPELVRHVREWLELAEAHYGVKPILYTGLNFYNRHLAGQFDDYPLWLARYDEREPVTVCGRGYQFWQYTDGARSPGIVGRVDQNVFLGTLAQLDALCIPVPGPREDTLVAK